MDYVIGSLNIVIGITNIAIGSRGITLGSWNKKVKVSNPVFYKWLYIIPGILVFVIGILY